MFVCLFWIFFVLEVNGKSDKASGQRVLVHSFWSQDQDSPRRRADPGQAPPTEAGPALTSESGEETLRRPRAAIERGGNGRSISVAWSTRARRSDSAGGPGVPTPRQARCCPRPHWASPSRPGAAFPLQKPDSFCTELSPRRRERDRAGSLTRGRVSRARHTLALIFQSAVPVMNISQSIVRIEKMNENTSHLV